MTKILKLGERETFLEDESLKKYAANFFDHNIRYNQLTKPNETLYGIYGNYSSRRHKGDFRMLFNKG